MESKRRKFDQKPDSKMQNGSQARSIITVELETVEKISEIQRIIGKRLRTKDLVNHEIFLQDIRLDPKLSLYEQGVKVFGPVELSVQVETHGDSGRLTIVEIAKNMTDDEMQASAQLNTEEKKDATSDSESPSAEKQRDSDIEKEDLGIPCDPKMWTSGQVHRWMMWVAREFGLDTSIIRNMGMSGKRISSMTIEEFFVKIPYGNILWSHLSLLKKISNSDNSEIASLEEAPLNLVTSSTQGSDSPVQAVKLQNPKIVRSPKQPFGREFGSTGLRSGSNGQIQLWQFLLELLTDPDERHLIAWVGTEGEFKLLQPERVAQKWGERKNKPAMNYEKLSRALRYYYDGDMINKVQGKRFVYQFVCNLKELIGYDAGELNRLVVECEQKRRSEREKGLDIKNGVIINSSSI